MNVISDTIHVSHSETVKMTRDLSMTRDLVRLDTFLRSKDRQIQSSSGGRTITLGPNRISEIQISNIETTNVKKME